MKSLALEIKNPSKNIVNKDCKQPIISIGIITHKRPHFLKETLEAIYPQLTKQIELVVVVDEYDEETVNLLLEYSKVKFKVSEHNIGRPKARNLCIREARGKYLIWVDDDDIPASNMISTYLDVIKNEPDIDIAYCDLQIFDSSTGNAISVISADDIAGYGSLLTRNLLKGKGITSGGALIRRSLFFKVGGYDERFLKAQDAELWFRFSNFARFKKVPRILYRYRKHSESLSFQSEQDPSYVSFAIRNYLQKNYLEEIFSDLNWNDPKRALAKALLHIAQGLNHVGDPYYANIFAERIDINYITDESLALRINTLLIAGEIKKAYGFLSMAISANMAYLKKISYLKKRIIACENFFYEFQNSQLLENQERVDQLISSLNQHIPISIESSLLKARMYEKADKIDLAKQYMLEAYRLNPKRHDIIEWYKSYSLTSSENEKVSNLQIRMYADNFERPLYYLAQFSHSTQVLSDKFAETPLKFNEYCK